MAARAGKTSSTPNKFGYDEHVNRADALLDELARVKADQVLLETKCAMFEVDAEACALMLQTGAAVLARILELCKNRDFVAVTSIMDVLASPLGAEDA